MYILFKLPCNVSIQESTNIGQTTNLRMSDGTVYVHAIGLLERAHASDWSAVSCTCMGLVGCIVYMRVIGRLYRVHACDWSVVSCRCK